MAIIDSNGTLLSSYHYSRLGQYAEGLMPAKKSRVFGYLDDNGEWAIEPQYYKAGPFVNGVAMVRYSPKYSNRKFYGIYTVKANLPPRGNTRVLNPSTSKGTP
ncbi:WG repeat-containing protein [Bacteroidia bacterium]|nr:WG repeat-containing protein [Bacteroidia bacterium]